MAFVSGMASLLAMVRDVANFRINGIYDLVSFEEYYFVRYSSVMVVYNLICCNRMVYFINL